MRWIRASLVRANVLLVTTPDRADEFVPPPPVFDPPPRLFCGRGD
jgi:hypothetical protein